MQKSLAQGMVLRSLSAGYASDRENLPAFWLEIYRAVGGWNENDRLWAESLLSSEHPNITFDDIWLVVDPSKHDQIISTTLLIPQIWRYESIEIPVGRPEAVATHPDYRNRGLIRALFEVCHERSAALGHLMQGITGIEHYYRRFGYSMAVDLGDHGMVSMSGVPELKDGQQPEYTLRDASEADYPQMSAWDDYAAPQFVLSVVREDKHWRWRVGKRGLNIQIIVNAQGEDVGYVLLFHNRASKCVQCLSYIVGEKSSYLATYNDVLRGIKQFCETRFGPADPVHNISFSAGQSDALGLLIQRSDQGKVYDRHYSWYLRVPDLARFMLTVKPVLEQRLIGSGAHRYTGELKINFYTQCGLRIAFENGCITGAENIHLITPQEQHECDAAFPWDSFLHLVFGYRTWREIQHILPECFANPKADVLFQALFPKKPSRLYPIG